MSIPEIPTRSTTPWFQFSVAWMLIVMTAVALLLGLSVTLGIAVLASLLWCVVPTPLVIIALFDRGDRQAFAIGALVPWLALLTLRIPPTGSFISLTIWLVSLGGICGAVAATTRRWIARRRTGQSGPSDCPV